MEKTIKNNLVTQNSEEIIEVIQVVQGFVNKTIEENKMQKESIDKLEQFLKNYQKIYENSLKNHLDLQQQMKKMEDDLENKKRRVQQLEDQQNQIQNDKIEFQYYLNYSQNDFLSLKNNNENSQVNLEFKENEIQQKNDKLKEEINQINKEHQPNIEEIDIDNNKYLKILEDKKPAINETQKRIEKFKIEKQEKMQDNIKLEKEIVAKQKDQETIIRIPKQKQNDLDMFQKNFEIIKLDIKSKNKQKRNQKRLMETLMKKFEKMQKIQDQEQKCLNQKKQQKETDQKIYSDLLIEQKKIHIDKIEIITNREDIEKELKQLYLNLRDEKGKNFTLEKEKLSSIRQFRLKKETLQKIFQNIKQLQNQQDVIIRTQKDFLNETEQSKKKVELIYEDQKLQIVCYDTNEEREEKEKNKIKQISKEVQIQKERIIILEANEQQLQKELKAEMESRELQGKKSIQTQNECKKIIEDISIKELIVVDENKKKHFFETQLQKYKILYEEVKKERNQYLNMIQTTSQDRSELKEHFKNLNREMQLLKNSLNKKLEAFYLIQQKMQQTTKTRDKRKNKLNIYDIKKNKLEDNQNCLINEINKLTGIIKNLDNNLRNITNQNDNATLQRNLLGQQITQINEEICYFYDEFSLKKNKSHCIKKKNFYIEKCIKLLKIQIVHSNGQYIILNARILKLPKLSDELIILKLKFDESQLLEKNYCHQLSLLDNSEMKRELGGENPPEEILNQKIEVLEQNLNNKKEIYLQKEIVREELEKMVEKVKEIALEDRKKNLKIVSESNEMKNKLRNIVKKIMTLVSELSIFQAIVVKLQNEKNEKENLVYDIEKRINNQMPPTDQSELNFLKIIRDQSNFLDHNEKRKKLLLFKQQVDPFYKKTTAEPRVEQYLTSIGLPKPFFQQGPFLAPKPSANLRFFVQNNFIKEQIK